MPLNNLSFLPGKVTCLSQNKDPLETYDRKLSDVVFCLQEYKRGGGGCRRTTFLVTANFLTSLAVAAFCLISSSSKSSYFCS